MKYGKSEDNRANGTTLDLCVIERMWSDDKHDYVQYYYNHPVRTKSYQAYLPKGNLARLGLRVRQYVSRHDEEDQSENTSGRLLWN